MISLHLDDNRIEAAIREQMFVIAAKIIEKTPIDPRYIFHTVEDVAKRLGCSNETVRGYIKEGKKTFGGKTIRLKSTDIVATTYRVSEHDLREFIDKINASTIGTGIKNQ